jgi:hypothetical protein
VQLAPAANVGQVVALQVLGLHEKPLPVDGVIAKPTPASGAPPVFFTVNVCGALAWPTVCTAKARLAGVTPIAGGVRPVPLRVTVSGWVRVMSVTVNVPL